MPSQNAGTAWPSSAVARATMSHADPGRAAALTPRQVPTTTASVVATVVSQSVAGSRVGVTHAPARPGEQARSAVRIDKAREVLGCNPAASLHDGLAETYAWIAERSAATVPGGVA